MKKGNKNIQNRDALKVGGPQGFRAYNARRCTNVGQALPDNKQDLIENNRCVVGPEQQLLRTTTLLNKLSGHALTYKGCSLRPLWEKVGVARMRGYCLFNLINPSPALRASSPARGEENAGRGFTLIELLVVVLIIGILAAVALPQYQKAVEKSRAVEALRNISILQQAVDFYVLEHGYSDIALLGRNGAQHQLEMEIENSLDCTARNSSICISKNFAYQVVCGTHECAIYVNRILKPDASDSKAHYFLYLYKYADTDLWTKICASVDQLGDWVCPELYAKGWQKVKL